MILGIDHVGLATDDPAAVGGYLAALGLQRFDAGVAEAYGVSCDFWRWAGMTSAASGAGAAGRPAQPAVEVVAPVREGSAVSHRLARNGPGLYHLALEVDDLDAELARLRGAGFTAVDREPCAGAREGMRVAFVYAGRPAGVLVELVQYGADRPPA
ncbi:MAG: VOC family protein [Frankiaceae bacterium]